MKLKAFLTIFMVLFSGIAINMGHEEVSSITFVYPEEYGLISGNITISADVASRVDGNYYLNNILFNYSVDGKEETIGTCDESVNASRGEDAGLVNRKIDWDTSKLDGRYVLEGVASYYYNSPLPDSETSDEKENKGKYGKYSLSGINFLKYDFKYGSNKPESPGEMPDTKTKSEDIVIYISNGTKKPTIDIVGTSVGDGFLANIIIIGVNVEDPFLDMVNNVKFEYKYLNGDWKDLGEVEVYGDGDYAFFWDISDQKAGEYKIRAYVINANEEVINSPEDGGPLYLTDSFVSNRETISARTTITIQ